MLMALTIVENILVDRVRRDGRDPESTRLDGILRWLFSAVYTGGLGVIALIYLT